MRKSLKNLYFTGKTSSELSGMTSPLGSGEIAIIGSSDDATLVVGNRKTTYNSTKDELEYVTGDTNVPVIEFPSSNKVNSVINNINVVIGNKFSSANTISDNVTNIEATIQNIFNDCRIPNKIVSAYNIGNIKINDEFSAGTLVSYIIERMLTGEAIGVDKVLPRIALNKNGNDKYEVGSTVNVSLSSTYTDGKFTGKTGYSYSVNAGCSNNSVSFYENGSNMGGTSKSYQLTSELSNRYTVSCSYGNSTVVPVNSRGESLPDVKINAGTATGGTYNVIGAYKYFYGYTEWAANFSYDNKFTTMQSIINGNFSTGWTDKDNTVVINRMESTDEKTSLVLIIPSIYDITGTKDPVGLEIGKEAWISPDTGDQYNFIEDYTIGGVTTRYSVYVCDSMFPYVETDIKITKK